MSEVSCGNVSGRHEAVFLQEVQRRLGAGFRRQELHAVYGGDLRVVRYGVVPDVSCGNDLRGGSDFMLEVRTG